VNAFHIAPPEVDGDDDSEKCREVIWFETEGTGRR
jgi:hypothetical protein